MIHEIGLELAAKLRAIGCTVPVVDGPEYGEPTTNARERIVIEHDEDGSDRFGPPRSQHSNPKHRYTRAIAGKITIYARSPSANATTWENRNRAEHILDLVLCKMCQVAAERKNLWQPVGGGFVRPRDLEQSPRPGGAVYELTFTFDRGVFEQTWDGDIRPTATLGPNAVRSRTAVSLAHSGDDDDDPNTVPAHAETACGGD